MVREIGERELTYIREHFAKIEIAGEDFEYYLRGSENWGGSRFLLAIDPKTKVSVEIPYTFSHSDKPKSFEIASNILKRELCKFGI